MKSFTNYSESLFLDYYYGKKAASEYVIGLRRSIANQHPIIGQYDVNSEGSSDMYNKGGNLLHTLRQLVDNDDKWRGILRKMNAVFYHQTVTTMQIENFLSTEIGIDLTAVFDQYLRDIRIPVFESQLQNGVLSYKWANVVKDFKMPVRIFINEKPMWLYPTSKIQTKTIQGAKLVFEVDPNFYIYTKTK